MVEDFFKILPVNTEEKDYVIVCGNVQASKEHFKTVKAAQEYINTKPWDLIFTISYAAHKALNALVTEPTAFWNISLPFNFLSSF